MVLRRLFCIHFRCCRKQVHNGACVCWVVHRKNRNETELRMRKISFHRQDLYLRLDFAAIDASVVFLAVAIVVKWPLIVCHQLTTLLECGPMPNVMVALPNISGALCWTPQSLGWRPLLQCGAVTLPRCETSWNLQGCPKLTKRSQPLVGQVHHIVRTCRGDIAA